MVYPSSLGQAVIAVRSRVLFSGVIMEFVSLGRRARAQSILVALDRHVVYGSSLNMCILFTPSVPLVLSLY